MAQFRGTIQGSRGDASRLGTKNSGLTVEANGWHVGVRVELTHEDGEDVARVYLTTGSNNTGHRVYLGKHSRAQSENGGAGVGFVSVTP